MGDSARAARENKFTAGKSIAEILKESEQVEAMLENVDLDCKEQPHYAQRGVQPIRYMHQNYTTDEFRGYLRGNIDKYLARWKFKNGLKDLHKARTYLNWLIEFETTGNITIPEYSDT